MVPTERLVRIFKPVAAGILAADADAAASIVERRAFYSSLDTQPASTAIAFERRAMVATAMRKSIAPEAGWNANDDQLLAGAYEWETDGIDIRLSKTTPESRQEAAMHLLGIQGELPFPVPPPPPGSPREAVLIRLLGNPLTQAKVDVVPVTKDGRYGVAISLRGIADLSTEKLAVAAPTKPSVKLPGRVRRTAKSD